MKLFLGHPHEHGDIIWAGFYSPLALSDIYFWPVLQLDRVIRKIIGLVVYGHAYYQTYVQILSIDSAFLPCDIEAGSDGSGAGGFTARQ